MLAIEGIRTFLRTLGEAAAPISFGFVSQYVFGGPAASTGSTGASSGAHLAGHATGLEYTFLVFLIPLLIFRHAQHPEARPTPTAPGSDGTSGAAQDQHRPPAVVLLGLVGFALSPAGRPAPPRRRTGGFSRAIADRTDGEGGAP